MALSRWFAVLALLAALLLFFAACIGIARADLHYAAVEREVTFWGHRDYQPDTTTIGTTLASASALAAGPFRRPEFYVLQANALAWRARWSGDDPNDYRAAFASQQQAVAMRPAQSQALRLMLEYASRADIGAADLRRMLRRLETLETPEVAGSRLNGALVR